MFSPRACPRRSHQLCKGAGLVLTLGVVALTTFAVTRSLPRHPSHADVVAGRMTTPELGVCSVADNSAEGARAGAYCPLAPIALVIAER